MNQEISNIRQELETENAEVALIKQQFLEKQRVLKVKEALYPYIRKGSKIVFHDEKRNRYKMRIPIRFKRNGKRFITAATEQGVYDKAYVYFFGDDCNTVRFLFSKVMEEKENDPDITSLTTTRHRQVWTKYYETDPIVDLPITRVKASDIKKFYKKITAGRVMSRSNFTNVKSIFNSVFDYAVENDLVCDNLARNLSCRDLKFAAVDNSNTRYTDEDRDKIFAYLDQMSEKTDYEYGIELMFCLCVRIGELRALRWTDVDFEKHTVLVSREIVLRRGEDGKNHFVEVNHTKGGEHGSRLLPLSEHAEKILRELQEKNSGSEHILTNQAGVPLDGNKFNKHLKVVTEAVGIPYMSSHKIRFWSVTALARATNGDIQTVMYVAGHADKNTTLHYIRAVRTDIQFDKIKECFS